jgi:hypothetical protein
MIAIIFNAHLLWCLALNKDSEKRARINLECSAVEVHRALGWVLRPEKASPIAKKACIHADRPRYPSSDALPFGLAFPDPSDIFIAASVWDRHLWRNACQSGLHRSP